MTAESVIIMAADDAASIDVHQRLPTSIERSCEVPRSKTLTPRKRRKAEPEERRQAILDAGLAVFSADGFAAAKLDDVAARADVAKGTIYLYFKDKHDLFEQIVRSAVAPVLAQLEGLAALPDLPTDVLIDKLFMVFKTQVLATDRKLVIRLVLTEGPHFPELAAFYHREVITKMLAMLRSVGRRGVARGDLPTRDIEEFPHLVFAPLLLALMWDGVFAKFAPLDVEGLLAAHRRLLMGGINERSTTS
jgi:AcrR family transcriptional regulator